MKTPLDIILERMKLYDPTEIIDLLNITSEELINKFYEEIERKQDFLSGEFEVFVITDEEELEYSEDGEWHED